MPLSWNEIRSRSYEFCRRWKDESSEAAEAKTFWNEFFNIFGLDRRRFASFEYKVAKDGDRSGAIDLLWKGVILIEHKSRGKDLDRAFSQAKDYFPGLKDRELPKYILVCDFLRFRLYNLEEASHIEFTLPELPEHLKDFGFIAGYQTREVKPEDPVNLKAAEKMGLLHDRLKDAGYEGHPLEVLLVRLLFCLFSDDTGIFEKNSFGEFIENFTSEDGSDLGPQLSMLFQTLDTPPERRQRNLADHFKSFPYVNGSIFAEQLPVASFDSKLRDALLDACTLNWSLISPAIFGSLFQSVMDPDARRKLGAHYTSEANILKLVKPLFLDALWEELEATRNNRGKLLGLHHKISSLKFLDPACGCGNFLIVSYRELRKLEIEIIRRLEKSERRGEGTGYLDISHLVLVNVDQFAGIEIEEFPSQIARAAMWLTDHQMNQLVSAEFGQYFIRLPLKTAPTIINGNALRVDWPKADFILGNPPFVGSKFMAAEQRDDLLSICDFDGAGVLDYVSTWYVKAAKILQESPNTRCAFVSTNSIAQGEQVGILWRPLMQDFGIKIRFAHRTFRWSNEAKGMAAVYCVIIGFGLDVPKSCRLFDYQDINGEPIESFPSRINAYLVEATDVFLSKRSHPLCAIPKIKFGNQPIDGGWLCLSPEEKQVLSMDEIAERYIRRYVGSEEFINGIERWCLWLKNATPSEIKSSPAIFERIKKVKEFRLASKRSATVELAATPSRFAFISHTESEYIIIPSVSSERRDYIPMGFMQKNVIASNLCLIIPDSSRYHLGVLQSRMHMAWVRYTCGRLKSDYRYSNTIVYNNYPWPEDVSERQRAAIEAAAQGVLDARAKYPSSTLADLYDPLTMPPDLLKAHQALDKAVDKAYSDKAFPSEAARISFLFELYQRYSSSLLPPEPEGRKRKAKRTP